MNEILFFWWTGSNLQMSIVGGMLLFFGMCVALALLDGGIRRSEREQAEDDSEQIAAVSRPSLLLWGDAKQITRQRAGTTGD